MISNSLATCTARPDGAPTETTMEMPPIRPFCNSSKLARPESNRRHSHSGVRSARNSSPSNFVYCVVAPYILPQGAQFAIGIEEPRAICDTLNLVHVAHDSLGHEKAGSKLKIISGRAHGYGNRLDCAALRRAITKLDFQRFLDGQHLFHSLRPEPSHTLSLGAAKRATGFRYIHLSGYYHDSQSAMKIIVIFRLACFLTAVNVMLFPEDPKDSQQPPCRGAHLWRSPVYQWRTATAFLCPHSRSPCEARPN